jgi:hypothetical protein
MPIVHRMRRCMYLQGYWPTAAHQLEPLPLVLHRSQHSKQAGRTHPTPAISVM